MAKKPYKRSAYAEKLLDPRWQKMRLEVLQRDGFACRECGDTTETLMVHHCFYEYGKEPWEYSQWMLRTLCETCHTAAEFYREWFKKFPPTRPLDLQEKVRTLLCNLSDVCDACQIELAEQFIEITEAVRFGSKSQLQAAFKVLDAMPSTDHSCDGEIK